MLRKTLPLAAWAAFGSICFVTFSPIDLRPETGFVEIERFAAYALLGALFALAYPYHFVRLAVFVTIAALSLEALQHLTPDRHGHLSDAMIKITGGLTGCSVGRLVHMLAGRRLT
jgi:VanZ family protein